jgi:hypothetical protein
VVDVLEDDVDGVVAVVDGVDETVLLEEERASLR